jgi:hypothetical protein
MGLLVVLLFTVPLVVAVVVVAVKVLEFALNRDIASAKVVAGKTTLVVLVTTGLALFAFFAFMMIMVSGDPS